MTPPDGTRWPTVTAQVTIDEAAPEAALTFTGQFYR